MYICNECKEVFEECEVVYESVPYGMGSAYRKLYVCPYCGENDFDEAERCDHCGEWASKESMTDGYCEECYEGDDDD